MAPTGSWNNQELLVTRVQELYAAAHQGRIHEQFEVRFVDGWYQIVFGEEGIRLKEDGTVHLRNGDRYEPVYTAGPLGAGNAITLLALLQTIATPSGIELSGPPDSTALSRILGLCDYLGDQV